VHVFPLGPDRMATIRAFADLIKSLTPQKEGSGASAPRTT
jgi:hypothetical protein